MDTECAICLDSEDESLKQRFKCRHTFHVCCVNHLASFQCPMCRQNIEASLTRRQQRLIQKRIDARYKSEHDEQEMALQEELLLRIALISFLLQPPVVLTIDKF